MGTAGNLLQRAQYAFWYLGLSLKSLEPRESLNAELSDLRKMTRSIYHTFPDSLLAVWATLHAGKRVNTPAGKHVKSPVHWDQREL